MLASHRNTVQVLERTDDSEPYTFAPSSISFQREMCHVLCTTRVEDSNNVGAHSPWTILSWNGIEPPDFWPFLGVWLGGGDESKWHRAESQWIVAARPLCHLQYPVAYLSRLQRILPAARWELYFKAARTAHLPHELSQRHVPLGAEAPTAGRQTGGGRMRRF